MSPPLEDPATEVHVTVSLLSRYCVTPTLVGAEGTVAGLKAAEAPEAALEPTEFLAFTVTV